MTSPSLLLGLDIGGTNTPFGLAGVDGELVYRDSVKTGADSAISPLLQRIFLKLEQQLGPDPGKKLLAIGVGAPNANANNGKIESPPNISWGQVDLLEEMRSFCQVPCFLTNDANAAALGEWALGWNRVPKDLLVITLGTGLGSGFIVNGELLHGSSGHAGELGHVRVEWPGRYCNCGLEGCLETRVSAQGMSRTWMDLLKANDLAKPVGGHSPYHMHAAAEAGDPYAAEAFRISAQYLARGLAMAIHTFSPEKILLCGGIAKAGHWILDPTRSQLKQQLMSPFRDTYTLDISRLDPAEAGLMGAVEWARKGLRRVGHV